MTQVTDAFLPFLNENGQPLEAGFIYIGEYQLDAETNPKAAFFDANLTVPAAQPIRTVGGRPVRADGTTATNLFVNGDYSITIKDVNSVLVSSTDVINNAATPADLAGIQLQLDQSRALDVPTSTTIVTSNINVTTPSFWAGAARYDQRETDPNTSGSILHNNGNFYDKMLPTLETVGALDYDLPYVIFATGQSNGLGGSGQDGGARVVRNPYVWVWDNGSTVPGSTRPAQFLVTAPGDADWPFLPNGNNAFYVAACDIQRKRGGVVILFMHCVGGQEIAEWLPNGGGVSGATGALHTALNSRMETMRSSPLPWRQDGATLTSLGREQAQIAFMHQGEADNALAKDTYKGRVRSVLNVWRTGQGTSADAYIEEEAPVLWGELLRGGTSSNQNVALNELDREESLFGIVSSDGLAGADSLHFDGEYLVEFGHRYADRIGIFPKLVPIENSLTDVDMGGRMRMLTASAVTVPISGTAAFDINALFGVTMASTGYVPMIAPVSVAGAQVYVDNTSWTNTGFTLVNPSGTNSGVVRVQIIGLVQ